MDDIYQTIEEYNPNEKRKILTFFNDMIADMLSNIKFNPMVFYYTLHIIILFYHTKKYTKFYALFYYQNSKETRTSPNYI